MTTHEVLVKARNLIPDPGHWIQRTYQTNDGRYCMTGALQAATDGYDVWHEARAVLAGVVGAEGTPSLWNDVPGRTHAEVLAAFDEAIALTAPAPDVSFIREPVAA